MYGGRLWVNQLARAAVLSPRIASLLLHVARWQPAALRLLTAKVVRSYWLRIFPEKQNGGIGKTNAAVCKNFLTFLEF